LTVAKLDSEPVPGKTGIVCVELLGALYLGLLLDFINAKIEAVLRQEFDHGPHETSEEVLRQNGVEAIIRGNTKLPGGICACSGQFS
jgi:hypothetical protein